MVLSKKVVVSNGGIHGFCWFAGEDIKAGEMIWEYGENVVYHDVDIPVEELNKWDAEKKGKFLSLAYMIKPGIYRGSNPDIEIPQEEKNEYYVNHACEGNCWYESEDLLVAARDIKKGEEIVYDYALTECEPDWILAEKCLCGKSACRGRVTGNDWKLPELQKKYGNHFTPHILALIEEDKKKQEQKE